MSKSQILFQKALYLLDRSNIVDGELNLRNAISLAKEEADDITLISAMACLGELLYELSRNEESLHFLIPVSQVNRDDDLLNNEITTAKKIVNALQGEYKK